MTKRRGYPSRVQRSVLVAVSSAVIVVCFWAFGGTGFASSSVSAHQYQYGKKTTICHNGNTISVSEHAVPAHLDHGDALGACPE